MPFESFDDQLYTNSLAKEPEPLQETTSQEYSSQMQPEPDDVTEILDHYNNLTLTDNEVKHLKADLETRNSMDLAILYDELVKLHKRTSEDPKDQLFLDVIKEEILSRGPNTLEDAKASKKAEFSDEKQRLMNQRQLVKAKASRDGIEIAKAEEADYQRMLSEFYNEWERIKRLGFEFPWLNAARDKVKASLGITSETPNPELSAKIDTFSETPAIIKDPLINPKLRGGHNEFTRNPAKFATVKPEALDINAEPEADLPRTQFDLELPRKTDNSRSHLGINDKRVDKEELLNAMRESSLDELLTLLSQYEHMQENDNNDEIVKEVIAVITEAIVIKTLETIL